MQYIKLAVNGTLMRGLELEDNLQKVGARFIKETKTQRSYRLWSIGDKYPAMLRVDPDDELAVQIEVEVWELPCAGLAEVLVGEPEGLSIGKVKLEDGETALGVLGESEQVKGMKEISQFGGWRNYIASLHTEKEKG